jgi:hypothetical protein
MKYPSWVVAHDATEGDDSYAVECLRCGDKQCFAVPISVTVYIAATKAFAKLHSRCRTHSETSKQAK